MADFAKPVIVISRCLGFDSCRYNGQKLNDEFIDSLKDYVNIITICPETDIGLETPRSSLRLVESKKEDKLQLVQSDTKTDYTAEMIDYSNRFLDHLTRVDGFILKNRSPTCAVSDAKLYQGVDGPPSKKGPGLFTTQLKKAYPHLVVEDEGRLTNFRIREDFLSKIYLMADFNQTKKTEEISHLTKFHSRNKYLLLTFNEKQMRKMGRIAANHEKNPLKKVFKDYEKELNIALEDKSSYTTNINVLMHGLGYFKDKIEKKEKQFFLDQLEKYRENKLPLSVPLNIMKGWIIKYEVDYLAEQSFFNPYPDELIDLKDSAKSKR